MSLCRGRDVMARHYHCQGCSCCSGGSKLFEYDHGGRGLHDQEDIRRKSNRRGILKTAVGRKSDDCQVGRSHSS